MININYIVKVHKGKGYFSVSDCDFVRAMDMYDREVIRQSEVSKHDKTIATFYTKQAAEDYIYFKNYNVGNIDNYYYLLQGGTT